MDVSRRQTLAFAIVGLLVLGVGVVAAAHISGTVPTSGAVSLESADGMNVTVDGTTDQHLEEPFPLSSQVQIVTEDGNATFTASGSANATVAVDEIEGTWTNLTALDADPTDITVDPGDKSSFVVGNAIDTVGVHEARAADDGTVDFVYSSTAPAKVTLTGYTGDAELVAVDRDSGAYLDVATASGSGTITFDDLDSGTHDVLVQTSDFSDPVLSNASPTGDQSTSPDTISIDVNDADFPAGDSVQVTIDLDGSQIHSETITSNQTVTASIPSSGKTGGQHSWSVDAVDDFGGDASDSFTYSIPTQIEFREEEPGHNLIEGTDTEPIRIEATFYEDVEDDPIIINRTTTDGTLDLQGLPVSSRFSVSVSAPGYHNRTVRLDDIFSQNDIFLVSRDADTVQNRFVVSDRTGSFPPEQTELRIQTAVNESLYNTTGGFQWMTVSGDDLGADEAFVDDLVQEKRYRIVVRNDAGDRRVLGAYTPEAEGTINLNIGSVVVDPEAPDSVGVNSTWVNETGSPPQVKVGYNDSTGNTTALHLHVYEWNNESNELVSNTTHSGPFGTFSHTEAVPAGENDTTWVVKLTAERSDAETMRYQRVVGPNAPVLQNMSAWIVTVIFTGTIWMVAGLFSRLNGAVGGLIVAALGGIFFFLDLVPPYLGGGVVALSMLAAALLFLRDRNAGGL